MSYSDLLNPNPSTSLNLHVNTLTIGSGSISLFNQLELNKKQALLLPRLTTSERNLLIPAQGQLVYNITTNQQEIYDGSLWVSYLPIPPSPPTPPVLYTVNYTLTPAELGTLFAVPVLLLPPPPVGKTYIIFNYIFNYVYGTATYAGGGGNINIQYVAGNIIGSMLDIALSFPNSSTLYAPVNGTFPFYNAKDKAIEVVATGAPLIAGDGTVQIIFNYQILDFNQ